MRSQWVVLFIVATIAGAHGRSATTRLSKANAEPEVNEEVEKGDKNAAVDKVIKMLEDLEKQVQAEGLEEAKTYDKFACFCKDTVKEKQDNIQSGSDEKEKLTTQINEDTAKRDELDSEIKTLVDEIKEKEKEIVKLKKENEEALKEYALNTADLNNALKGLKEAIKVLKASKDKVSFVQLPKDLKDTVQSAAALADALGLARGAAVTALLQDEPVEEAKDDKKAKEEKKYPDLTTEELKVDPYEFHAGDIVSTLEKLQTDFEKKKSDIDEEETKRKDKFDSDMADAKKYIEDKEKEMDDKKKERAEKVEAIATASSDFSGISAQFLDDQEYLQELVQICSDKAKTWDSRQKVRTDEISALNAAIGIIKGEVSENTSDKTVRLIQQKFSAARAEFVVRNEAAMEAVEADAEKQEDSGAFRLSFLQRRQSHPHLDGVGRAAQELQRELDHPEQVVAARQQSAASSKSSSNDGGRAMVMALLRKEGMALHSAMLTSLAAKVEKDPFAKVKKLIQELIERMLAQAANEANQKGWCDKSLSDAKQKRDYTAEDLADINAEMAVQEARRDKLIEELAVLANETAELEKAQAEADKVRAKEKGENEETIKEAKDGLAAVEKAIEILDRFYKTAAKSEVSFADKAHGPKDDAPDAGFESGEAYQGAQGDAKGVIGMLEVIKSDFVRTVKKTEEAEAQAEDDHLKFTTETQSSLKAKNEAITIRTTQKDDTLGKLADLQDGMNSKTELLISTIQELKKLHETCIDTGMTYEERMAAREEEIEALKKALCIFNAYEEFGPDGAGNQC